MRQTAMKRSQPKRDWSLALEKVEEEGRCRSCGAGVGLQAAHVLGREFDRYKPGFICYQESQPWTVAPDRIIPLCPTCHGKQHDHKLSIEPLLTNKEAAQAVLDAGSLESARIRITGSREHSA